MRYHLTLLLGLFMAAGTVPCLAGGGDIAETKALQAGAPAPHPTRQIVTSRTFTPEVIEFLQRPLASQLVTLNPNGTPQVTIMWFKYENGALLFTTTTDRVKFRNMQKDPHAAFAVLDPTNMYQWVIVHGTLSVVDHPDPVLFYEELARHYLNLDDAGVAAWRKTAMLDKRVVLRLTPTRVRTMGFPRQ
ncbi:MAG: PPOX class F420-dependent oxidoreductase [Candidatus Binatia bacterium]|nr:PPOX class F420-dependent oxidoreductase [Candidatus Binatia bacterium]